jgi:tRNA nucleotidyltransferase (CCA-adding enzyme)
MLLGGEAVDLDVVVEGDAAAAARTAAERLGGRVREHERFGTATVEAEELAFDVARARRERYPAPGALPEVEPASLEEDLLRRDFTVNALAVALGPPDPGALHAVPRGREDLDARRLRVFHDESFRDDPTRLLRLVRYATRLRFAIEPRTEELARAAVAAGAPATVSGGRIGDELRLLLREPEPNTALRMAGDIGLDRALHPAFAPDADAAERARALLPPDGREDLVILAAATRGLDPEGLAAWLDELEFPAPERDLVVAAALGAAALGRRLAAASRPSEIATGARGHSPEAVALAAAVVPEAVPAARRWLDELRHVALDIDGEDVLAASVREGPDVGRALAEALARKLDGEVAGRDAELAAALAAIGRE